MVAINKRRKMLTMAESKIERAKERAKAKKEKEKKPQGRPTSYTDMIAKHICNEIMKGRSLKKICTQDKNMPSEPTVYSWLQRGNKNFNEMFFNNYREAKDIQAERFVEEIVDISDDGENDTYSKLNPKTGKYEEVVDYDHIRRSELRIKARMWTAARILPKKYGDKSMMELSGPDGKSLAPEKIIIDFGNGEQAELEDE